MLLLINPVLRAEPFDHPDWLFEAKFDGFRAAADTVRGQLISRNGNRMKRFEEVLGSSMTPAALCSTDSCRQNRKTSDWTIFELPHVAA